MAHSPSFQARTDAQVKAAMHSMYKDPSRYLDPLATWPWFLGEWTGAVVLQVLAMIICRGDAMFQVSTGRSSRMDSRK